MKFERKGATKKELEQITTTQIYVMCQNMQFHIC